MAITYDGANITFEAVIYEDEVVSLREKLNEIAPEIINFNMKNCDDIHLSIIQQMLAYKKVYECNFDFADDKKTYQMVIEGFDLQDCRV